MAELPTGTVTFLFTDIEGSTELLAALGDGYAAVLERHNRLLRAAFARHDAVEVMSEGDAFFVVFRNPAAAVQAAVAGQRTLSAEQWPSGADVRVRMGLHTGEAVLGGDNYVGLDVHRASRIASAGHGGQILTSDATRGLVEQSLPEGVGLRDLGRHRLKGLPAAERIFQLMIDDLPSDFPPISSLEVRPHNLPLALTSFVGRERQVAELRERLSSTRLLTMTGPGGTGKTRLSIRVAEEVIADYEHGCWFVALDALRDPELVPPTIAGVLGVRIPPDKPVMTALESWLADRQLLLVLDNFEQLGAAASHVGRLLRGAPGLRVLATSRTPLHIYGEQEYPVPPLASASELRLAGHASAESLTQYEAVQLFIERAVAVKPDFRVTNANAPAVAEVCARLDGLPLAIELAAARVKLLTPEQMLVRLGQNLSLLASSARDLPERQRTLRGAIDWSYDLLSEPERQLFARLSVFRGGFSLDAAERVSGGDGLDIDVLDVLSSLVDKSLLRTVELSAEARFTMLETLREYARERLTESAEADGLMKRHAAYFLALATDAGPNLMGADQLPWLDRLERDQDNLRAALARAPEHAMLDDARRAAGSMWRFWQLRGRFAEGRAILERLLEASGGEPAARAAALTGAGGIAYWQNDFEAVARHYREARELYESLGDGERLAEALYNESYVPALGGDPAAAQTLIRRAIELYRNAGNELGATEAEFFLGYTHHMKGEPEAAVALAEKAIDAYRAAGAQWYLGDGLIGLGFVRASAGQWARAAEAMRESMAIFHEMASDLGQTMVFEAVATGAASTGDAERAALLIGKVDGMKEQLGGGPPTQIFFWPGYRAKARRDLGAQEFERLTSEGLRLTTAQAVELVQQFRPPPDALPLPAPNRWADSEVEE